MRCRSLSLTATALCALAAPAPAAQDAEAVDLLVCAPGFPGTAKQAKSVMDALARAIAKGAGWAESRVRARYVANEKAGLEALKSKRPALLLTTIPFYCKHHARIGGELVAGSLLNGRPTQTFRVLVPAGTCQPTGGGSVLSGLMRKRITGTRIRDRRFVARVLFAGPHGDDPEPERLYTAVTQKRTLRAVKQIAAGKADAVLLSDEEWRLLQTPNLRKRLSGLEVLFRSKPIPTAPVVALGRDPKDKPDPAFVKTVRAALLQLHKSDDGKKLCERLRLTGFGKPDAKAYAGAVKLYHPKKKPAKDAKRG